MVQRRSAPFDPLCGSLACQTNWFSASLGCDVQLSAAVASNSTGFGTWVCRPEPGKLLLLLPHTAMLIFAKYSSAFFMLFRRGHMPALRFLSAFFSRGCQCFSSFRFSQRFKLLYLAIWPFEVLPVFGGAALNQRKGSIFEDTCRNGSTEIPLRWNAWYCSPPGDEM